MEKVNNNRIELSKHCLVRMKLAHKLFSQFFNRVIIRLLEGTLETAMWISVEYFRSEPACAVLGHLI